MCCVGNWYLLGLKNISSYTQKTGSWYLLGIVFKISNKHPRPYYMGVSPSGRNYARKSVTHKEQQTKAISP